MGDMFKGFNFLKFSLSPLKFPYTLLFAYQAGTKVLLLKSINSAFASVDNQNV